MEYGLPTSARTFSKHPNTMSKSTSNHKESAPKSLLHVNFSTDKGELTDRKKKYLTAKYGQHQMSLIKKRLRVEMWMYEELQSLYQTDNSNDIEIDLDELLDLDEDKRQKDWLRNKLMDAKQSKEAVEHFIVELLEKAKTL